MAAMNAQKRENDGLMTKTDLAGFFEVKSRTVDSWMSRGKVPYFKIARTVRFRLADVLASLNESNRIN
jgi:hypothetical protein